MKGPVPTAVRRDLLVERTGDIATTPAGHCYECGTDVPTEPLMDWTFDDLDARIKLWCCQDCYFSKQDDSDWNDASKNV